MQALHSAVFLPAAVHAANDLQVLPLQEPDLDDYPALLCLWSAAWDEMPNADWIPGMAAAGVPPDAASAAIEDFSAR